jgi:hypothetical protein
MKKLAGIVLFLLVAASIFAEDDVGDWVNGCISLLGKPVPKEFERAGRDAYRKVKKGITIVVFVKNGIIYGSGCVASYMTNKASFVGKFYDYLEKNNWQYYGIIYKNEDIYTKDGIYAVISTTGSSIWFINDLDNYWIK